MYKVGDIVIHKREGISKIVDTAVMSGKTYYLLEAKRNGGEKIYVPLDSIDNCIRPIMDVKSADDVLKYMSSVTKDFIANTKQRRDNFKRKLISGNIYDIAYLVMQLHLYLLCLNDNYEGVHFGPTDIEMLTVAKNILFDELAHTYNLNNDDVANFVNQKLNSF